MCALRLLAAFLRARPAMALGYGIVAAVVLLAVLAPAIAPFPPEQSNPVAFLQPPGWPHLLGTDAAGMDVLSRVIWAPRIDLAIALVGTLLSAVPGSLTGALVGYYEGHCHARRRRAAAFPVFVFAIALLAVFGQSLSSIVLAIAIVIAPTYL